MQCAPHFSPALAELLRYQLFQQIIISLATPAGSGVQTCVWKAQRLPAHDCIQISVLRVRPGQRRGTQEPQALLQYQYPNRHLRRHFKYCDELWPAGAQGQLRGELSGSDEIRRLKPSISCGDTWCAPHFSPALAELLRHQLFQQTIISLQLKEAFSKIKRSFSNKVKDSLNY